MGLIDLVNIRQLQLNDLNFILSSSTKCLIQYLDTHFKGWEKQALYKHLEKVILFGLGKCGYSIFIACIKEDENHIIGYIVADPTTNHIFLQYTKYAYRKLGLQKNLLLPLVVDHTHRITVNWPTKEMIRLVKRNLITIDDKFVDKLMHALTHKEII